MQEASVLRKQWHCFRAMLLELLSPFAMFFISPKLLFTFCEIGHDRICIIGIVIVVVTVRIYIVEIIGIIGIGRTQPPIGGT